MLDTGNTPTPDRGSYDFAVVCKMETELDFYQQDRKKYHDKLAATLGGDAKKTWTLIQQTSEALIKGVGELASFSAIPEGQRLLRELVTLAAHAGPELSESTLAVLELVNEDVAISLGWEAMHLMRGGEERFWTLLSLTASVEPSWRTAAFLKRVSRCYLFSFDAECVVMCRSVLDAEFEAQVPREYCEDKFGCRRGKYTLEEKILVAEDRAIVSPEIATTAHEIRDLGNKAVHNWPALKKDAADVIGNTLQVLKALGERQD